MSSLTRDEYAARYLSESGVLITGAEMAALCRRALTPERFAELVKFMHRNPGASVDQAVKYLPFTLHEYIGLLCEVAFFNTNAFLYGVRIVEG